MLPSTRLAMEVVTRPRSGRVRRPVRGVRKLEGSRGRRVGFATGEKL